jgi:hypothetical protein
MVAERVVVDSFYGLAGEEDDAIATFTDGWWSLLHR